MGVFQKAMFFQYAVSAAWYVVQKFLSLVSAQALALAGASPKYSATWALTFGETIQLSHW